MDTFLDEHVWSMRHWPFIAVMGVLMIVGQVVKTSVFTKERAFAKGKYQNLLWWGYKTLPLHPIAAGFLIGLIWKEPEADVRGVASAFYFAMAGAGSVVSFNILKSLAKKRGITIELPGESVPPTTVTTTTTQQTVVSIPQQSSVPGASIVPPSDDPPEAA